MNDTILTNTLAVVVGSAVVTRIVYSWLTPKPIPNIPHNPITSIWGDIPAIVKASKEGGKHFVDYVDDMVKMHGQISQFRGNKPERPNCSTHKSVEVAHEITQLTLLPIDETWKMHRRISGPSMSRRYLERMSARISAGASNLVKLWKDKVDIVGSCAFDAGLDIQLSTMDTMGDITMGSSFGCIGSAQTALPTGTLQSSCVVQLPRPNPPPLYGAVSAMMEGVEAAIKAPFPSLYAWLNKYTSSSWRKQFNILSSFLNHAITEARERESMTEKDESGLATDADCVLDMIIQREVREGAEAFGEAAIHDELMSFIFAGQDTTSSMIRWLVKYLSADAKIQHRLHSEVCGVFGPDEDLYEPLDFNLLDDSERVPLLEAVVAETMRCAGVGPQISRE
ncbi:hypothetical protein FRC11_012524, partial [Ceratobasidium sp. 423]